MALLERPYSAHLTCQRHDRPKKMPQKRCQANSCRLQVLQIDSLITLFKKMMAEIATSKILGYETLGDFAVGGNLVWNQLCFCSGRNE